MKKKGKNTKSTKSRLSRKGKKYNWFQISAYIIILLMEEAWNFIMHPSKNESKVKSFLLRTGWSVANLYACAIIIAHPFIMDYNLLRRALYIYPVMGAVSFIIGPKESVRYIIELFKDIKDNNNYDYLEEGKRKSVIIDIKEYRDKQKHTNQVNNNTNNDDDMFYHYQ